MKKEAKEPKESKKTLKKTTEEPAAAVAENTSAEDKTLDNDGKVGTMLRETRLKKGEDLADIARKLCIRKVHLEAIEDSNYDGIPEAPYGQGFVRSYADYLGLNPVRIAQLFKEETDANSRQGELYMLEPQAEATVPNRKYILISLLAVAAVYFSWVYYNAPAEEETMLVEENVAAETAMPAQEYPLQVEEYGQGSATDETQTDEVQPGTEEKEQLPLVNVNDSVLENTPQVTVTEENFVETPSADDKTSPVAAQPETVESEAPAPAVPEARPEENSAPVAETDGLKANLERTDSKVVMKVNKEAWIEAKSPDKLYISKVVEPGFVYNVPDEKGMIISAGRVDAVDVFVNGKLMKNVFTVNKKTGISVDNLLQSADN